MPPRPRRLAAAPALLAALALASAVPAARAHGQAARREAPSGAARDQAKLSPRVDIDLAPRATEAGPLVRGADILGDGEMRELVRNGFPARMHYRVDLWSAGGMFDDLEASVEWDVFVRYDPLGQDYRVIRIVGDRVQTLGRFRQYQDAIAAAEQPYRAPIRPPRSRERHYYNVTLDVEVMSLDDLDEVERWLRGELRPAVRGERNPATAVSRGVRTVVVRLLGGEKRTYSKRTPAFRAR